MLDKYTNLKNKFTSKKAPSTNVQGKVMTDKEFANIISFMFFLK